MKGERDQHSRRLDRLHPTDQSVDSQQYGRLHVWPCRHLDRLCAADAAAEYQPQHQPVGISELLSICVDTRRARFQLHHPRRMDDGRRPLLQYRGLHDRSWVGGAFAHRYLPARADWPAVHAAASSADRTDDRVFKRFIDRPGQRSVVPAADLLRSFDRKALTMLPRKMNSLPIAPRFSTKLAKASAAFVAVVTTAGCGTTTTGVTQLPVPPNREQTAFTAAPPSNGPPAIATNQCT